MYLVFMKKDLEKMANDLEVAANELEMAQKHLLIAAKHFREAKVPRGCAHTFATQGHLSKSNNIIMKGAELHSTKSRVE